MAAPMMSRSESTSDSASITSKSSTPETTPLSTPAAETEDTCDTCKIGSKPLPALHREFPKPPQEVDVQTLLGRQPGRWTIQGQIAANNERAKASPAIVTEEQLKQRRAREFEAAKKDLLAFHIQAQPSSGSQW
ncbi:hypothetical protein B0T10DRAFT_181298 [Thelonectria olida]|uniref:Uncharacterized protein n=1 Tax=Thelonectria olida TaxID=1576542 RepID=A0A9P8WET0_9HYPO|nr:hypothetical protein B0T10DRAFT_181298 [Thelonectria olida]